MLLAKDAKVEKLSDLMQQKEDEAKSPAAPGLDLTKEIRASVRDDARQAVEVAPPPGEGPLLKWRIANGLPVHGFQIFRADKEDGFFVLQNKLPIRSTATDEDSVSYQWRDTAATAGHTYWYYIGLLNKNGTKQQLTGPQRVEAK
jgi:hypothetical protein